MSLLQLQQVELAGHGLGFNYNAGVSSRRVFHEIQKRPDHRWPGRIRCGVAAARPLRCQSALTSGMTVIHSGGTYWPP